MSNGMEVRRGEIYYIENNSNVRVEGSEQKPNRPAIVVSNDKNNAYSSVIEVVYLTTKPKANLPTHVDIMSTGRKSVALCEQVSSVSIQRFGDYVATCSEYEMLMVDAALAISLSLNLNPSSDQPKVEGTIRESEKQRIVELETACIIYRTMCFELIRGGEIGNAGQKVC